MSKRKKNYPDPMGVIDKYGSDALRYIHLFYDC
jgi:isoleucyl-tRNA synthetase